MELEDLEIERFKLAWQQDFGETLSDADARSELARLLTFLYAMHDSANSFEQLGGKNQPECDNMTP